MLSGGGPRTIASLCSCIQPKLNRSDAVFSSQTMVPFLRRFSDVAALRTEDGSGFEFWLFESLVEKKREHITHPMLVPRGMQFTRSEFRLPM